MTIISINSYSELQQNITSPVVCTTSNCCSPDSSVLQVVGGLCATGRRQAPCCRSAGSVLQVGGLHAVARTAQSRLYVASEFSVASQQSELLLVF